MRQFCFGDTRLRDADCRAGLPVDFQADSQDDRDDCQGHQ